MGGSGSGRWNGYERKDVVEDCLRIDINRWMREGIVKAGHQVSGTWVWRDSESGLPIVNLAYEVDTVQPTYSQMRLKYWYSHTGQTMELIVPLEATPVYFGGVRWWFRCPIITNGIACGRRVAKLYLPTDGAYYGCRHCHDLTYTSCQQSHQYDAIFDILARQSGLTPAAIKRNLSLHTPT